MLRWQNRTVFILWSPREGGKDSEREQRGEASRRCLLIGRKGFCLAGVHRMKCWRQSNKLPRWAGLIRSADVNGRVWIIVMLSLAELGQGRLEKSVCVKSFFFFLSSECASWLCKAVIMQQINRWTGAILPYWDFQTWAFTKNSKQAIVNHIRYVFFPTWCARGQFCAHEMSEDQDQDKQKGTLSGMCFDIWPSVSSLTGRDITSVVCWLCNVKFWCQQ